MNFTQNVAKQWDSAKEKENTIVPKMVLSRHYAKKLRATIAADLEENQGEDILVRVIDIDDGLLQIWLGNRHYWKLTRSQAFRLMLRCEAFLTKRQSDRLVMSFNQVRFSQIQLMAVNKNGR